MEHRPGASEKVKMMEAIVLAGGLGTRLKSVVSDLPKPMAPVNGRPFLSIVLHELAMQGINRAILSTGFLHEVVEDFFGSQYEGIKISYSREDEPLGTGGAIRQAMQMVRSPFAFVLNGDTLFKADLKKMAHFHQKHQADMTLALKEMQDFSRYGTVDVEEGRITRFHEKSYREYGLINGGIYLLNQHLVSRLQALPHKFSFEKDFMEAKCNELKMMGFPSNAYFIDIGIPEDYERAHREIPDTA
ncbi:MAG: nucleotidyltransferase family protein [Cyclobacteriaceae bacterium]